MKAISLTEPMAWAIFHGKDIENRTWPTKFRGRVYIHASKGFNKEHYRWICENNNRLVCGDIPFEYEFVHGAIIGEVTIVDCVQHHGSRWAMEGQWQFVLENPVLYDKSIPCKGMRKFFEPVLLCSKCGKEKREWDGLCQMCWEAYCSAEWWRTEGGLLA